ncbi:2-dehydropantoate 2-reductase N-terminal domain-containing protein [Streptomyces sp. NPDC046977]|uniref:NAD(P)H-dependent glycerol-3-phosphate dehydrogenase n=1 Tax=Streptomyces sp. NPDC046977 TaxID=3154703 RepID=UPI0033E71044
MRHPAARAAVFSAGSWGTAVAKIMADAGTDVTVHARRHEIAEAINTAHRNPGYHPDIDLPTSLTATTEPATALAGADLLVLSVPAQTIRASLTAWAPFIGPDTVIVSLMKGIERHSHLRVSQIIAEVTGIGAERIAVLSGPNLAREIMTGRPAAATIACTDEDAARRVQRACHTSYFRPYTSTEVAEQFDGVPARPSTRLPVPELITVCSRRVSTACSDAVEVFRCLPQGQAASQAVSAKFGDSTVHVDDAGDLMDRSSPLAGCLPKNCLAQDGGWVARCISPLSLDSRVT